MNKVTKQKIFRIIDSLLTFDFFSVVSNLIYGGMISVLFTFFYIGITAQLIEGYFQFSVFVAMFVFCLREADKHFSKLSGLWFIVGVGIFIHFLIIAAGRDSVILRIIFPFSILLVVTSAIYHLGFRKYFIKKFKLSKLKEVKNGKR